MAVDSQSPGQEGYGIRGDNDIRVDYDYNDDARLDTISTGAGDIRMEYDDFAEGGGIQTVVDDATGGRTEVEYDSAGRVTRQVDPAGVVTSYSYYDPVANPDDFATSTTTPAGALASQTEAGVTTRFAYDLSPYEPKFLGYEGIAQQFVLFWSNPGEHEIIQDFPPGSSEPFPGYLRSSLRPLGPMATRFPARRTSSRSHTSTFMRLSAPCRTAPRVFTQ